MIKVLLVEDDYNLRFAYAHYLEKNGFLVIQSANGQFGYEEFLATRPDIIVSDIMMPMSDGNDLLHRVRKLNPTIPFLILTALDSINDKTRSFDLGADDYLSKPFAMKELVLRINALVRRDQLNANETIILGNTILDRAKRELKIDNINIELTHKEFELLFKLLSNLDVVFSRETLLNEIWGYSNNSLERTVDAHISGIRKKCLNAQFSIKNVRSSGYKGVYNEQ